MVYQYDYDYYYCYLTVIALITIINSTTIAMLNVVLITLVTISIGKKAYQKSPKETGGKIFVA